MICTFSCEGDIQSNFLVQEMLQKVHERFEIYRSYKFFRIFKKNVLMTYPPHPCFPLNLSGRKLSNYVFPALLHFLSIFLIEVESIMLRAGLRSLTSTSPLNKPVSGKLDVFFKHFCSY